MGAGLAMVLLAAAAGGLVGTPRAELPAANVAASCQWPTVVSFRAGEEKCTGTLVHPEVVVTASHCIVAGTPERMRFGEEFSPEARTIDVAECWSRAEFDLAQDPAEDVAACRLVAPVPDVPPTPLLDACDTAAAIVAGADVTLVGFGIPQTGGEFGTKRYAFTRVVEPPRDDGTFVAGDAMVDGCDGDSGGPALLRLADGTWHVAGVLVYGPECGHGPSRYLAPARHLAWLEDVTGRDLSPCRDDADAWDPGPGCEAALDPQAVFDGWDAWCDGPRAVPGGAVCPVPPEESGTTDPADDDGASGETTAVPEPTGSTSVGPVDTELPQSREGCRVSAPRPADLGLAPWAIGMLAIARRRREPLTRVATRADARCGRGRHARARAESRPSWTMPAGSPGSTDRA